MKKLNLLAILLLLLVSCNNDDTFVPQCETAYSLGESNITHSSATLHWQDDNPSASYTIEYGPTGFVLGSGSTANATEKSITITGLQANTTYDFYVKSICDANNVSILSDVRNFSTQPPLVVAEFRPNLSELNLFQGALKNLQPSVYTFEYKLNTALYTDYAHKQRIIALPPGESMTYNGDGLPNFPDNTLIAKTFYYNIDDRNELLGKTIIETRVLLKVNGEWLTGNYKWNASQTEAVLDNTGSTLPVTWVDNSGSTNNVNYKIPSDQDCFTCHQTYLNVTPIGPKLRSMNYSINGINQLRALKDRNYLTGVSDPSTVSVLPNWEDASQPTEARVRAYFDMNCAHCHSSGGFHNENYYEALKLNFETSFNDSNIYDKRWSIMARIQTSIDGYSMPFIGVTTPHTQALDLIIPYLESL